MTVHSLDQRVWYRRVDTNDDGVVDSAILYDNPAGEGGVFAVLENFADELSNEDFFRGAGITLTEITMADVS